MSSRIPGNKNLRRKKRLRKSIAALFMITALIVAAIPVPEAEALTPAVTTTIDLPDVAGATVYFDNTKTFGVAYVTSGATRYGVLVYYNGGTLGNSSLTIPDSIEAYTYNSTTGDYYPMYKESDGTVIPLPKYKITETVATTTPLVDADGKYILDAAGKIQYETQEVTTYYDCTLDNRDIWIEIYDESSPYHPLDIPINYVNDEAYVPSGSGSYSTNGVFEGKTNFLNLTIPSNIYGIGDNAFKGCKVSSIVFDNGLQVIGNGAFKNCTNLSTVTFTGTSSSLKEIGQEAFYECRSLSSIVIPSSVDLIGDSAFQNCYSLATVNLYGQTNSAISTDLDVIGNYAFKNCEKLVNFLMPDYGASALGDGMLENCTALETVKFSNDYTGEIPPGIFTGCSSLYHLIIPDESTDFAETYEISEYNLGSLSEDFYIEGKANSTIHDYCKIASTDGTSVKEPLAFKELSGNLYEKQINGYLYVVDSNNNLVSLTVVDSTADLANVVIPASLGGYKITNIDSNSFWHNTDIEKVTIPSSVLTIASGAFSECTNLEKVVFSEPVNITSIGTDAFKTGGSALTFFGTISNASVPFQYAMNPDNNYNLSNQEVKYIKFYSSFPTSLLVQYNPDTKLNELLAYPSYATYLAGADPLATAAENAVAASALKKYEDQLNGTPIPADEAITEDEMAVIDSVLNIVLPSGIESFEADTFQDNDDLLSITMTTISDIPEEAFSDCNNLKAVTVLSSGATGGESVGDYAFRNCDSLTDVTMAGTVSELGLRPFVDCAALTTVNFSNGTNFVCTNGIIFQLTNGVKTKIIECLETRGSTGTYTVGGSSVAATELATVTSIAKEAFLNCDGIGDVNLSTSKLVIVPESCFENTSALYSVELPSTCTTIMSNAFLNSSLRSVTIPSSVTYIESNAFDTTSGGTATPNTNITVSCAKGSAAETFALTYGLTIGDILLPTFTVMFFDYNNTVLNEQTVVQGADAVPPATPTRTGYTFVSWTPSYLAVSRDLSVVATYERDTETTYTVTFLDYNGTTLATRTVRSGEDASPPDNPSRTGYTFTGWAPSYRAVTKDLTILAQYTLGTTTITPTTGTTYKLTVTSGAGGGSFASGASVTITANAPSTGKVFDKWTTTSTDVTFANASSGTTTITMPAHDTTVTATYKSSSTTTADSSTSTTTGTTGTTTGTTGSTTTGSTTTGTTTVVTDPSVTDNIGSSDSITANVDGSSDNFVIKITETSAATAAVESALKNEYGTLDNLAYYAMDISLYDSTGTTKITDTTGLSIAITLPIPDDLVSYAGNNQAASVLDSKLENLDEKFTTIDGVSCVTFNATHFSPYAVYVDTANLTAGVADSSPKTGDFVETKWLLVLGFASISVILFLKRDKEEKLILVP